MFQTNAAEFTSERWAGTTLGRIRATLKEQYPDEYHRRYPNNGHADSAKPAAAGSNAATMGGTAKEVNRGGR
jgi:hypothetical protein